jgi:hypothetical protein
MTDWDKQEEFVEFLGVEKADWMQRLWDNTYKCGTAYDFLCGRGRTKKEVFVRKAKEHGFSAKEIGMFLSL